jgi:TonB-linked SusC/RagA family outer membrane protein
MLNKVLLTLTILFVSIGAGGANPGYSQDIRVSLKINDRPVKEVFSAIESQTSLAFFYSENVIDVNKKVSVSANNELVGVVLDKVFAVTGNSYVISGEQVFVSAKTARQNAQQPAQSPQQPAQNAPVTGTVVDQNGQPIIGAFVGVKGTTGGGTLTDNNGQFSLTVPAGATLEVSYFGHTTQEIVVGALRDITVTMLEDLVRMDEVLVVAFGEQKRSSFTGSASVVSAEAIARRPVTSVMSAIEGLAPGVQIQTTSNAPDGSVSIRIRGTSSINAGTNPLIIVDGAPYVSSMHNINPNDVESMTVLKDAASTALYGARGGNGVIMITTKKATRQERVGITFDARVALTEVRKSDLYDVITDPGQYYEEYYRAAYNYYLSQPSYNALSANQAANSLWTKRPDQGGIGYLMYTVPEGEQLIGHNGKLNPNATLGRITTGQDGKKYMMRPDNWFKESFKMGVRQDYNVSMRGGSEFINMLASLGYTNDKGVSAPTSYERYTGRINGTMKATKWLTFRGTLDMARGTFNHHSYDYSSNSNNIFSNVNEIAPIYPVYIRDENGNILHDSNGKVYDFGDGTYNVAEDGSLIQRPIRPGSNRIQEALLNTNRTISTNINGNAAVDITILPELTVTASAAYTDRERRNIDTAQPFYGSSNPTGAVDVTSYRFESLNTQQLINYAKSFGLHNVKATLLHEYNLEDSYYLTGNRSNMFSYLENQELAGAVNPGGNYSYARKYQNEGFGGRVLYDYNGTYHFNASYRRDGSSKFHSDNRWGNFYSFGGAWIISNEQFFKVPWMDMLKFKVSVGQNGNDQIPEYRYTDTYDIMPQGEGIGLALRDNIKGNPYFSWETRTAVNVGAEAEMFKGHLRANIEYYNTKTTEMLFSVHVPGGVGYQRFYDNVGDMRNSGVEFEIEGHLVRNRDWRVSLNLNGAINKAKVSDLSDENTEQTLYDSNGKEVAKGYSNGAYFYGEGLEYRTWYLKKFAGVNEEGLSTWYVMDEETGEISTTSTYSQATEFAAGSSQPKITGGFGGNVGWKSFDLNFRFAYRLGGYAYDGGYATLMQSPSIGRTGYNFHKDILNAWTPEKPNNTIPRWQMADLNVTSSSDKWLTKADYLSLQNISLSYSLPRNFLSKMGVAGATVSVGVDDVFFLSKRKGFIPSRDFDGNLGLGYYPNTRRYMMSLKIDF